MKKVIMSVVSIALMATFGVASSAPANAVNCNAFNQGTANAFHMHNASGNGLIKIAMACHPS